MSALLEKAKREKRMTKKRLGFEKNRKWTAWAKGAPEETVHVEGDTAYYAWNEAARELGVEPHNAMVQPIDPPQGCPTVKSKNHDPWHWMPPKKKPRKRAKRKKK